jgi:hypothetical protein
MLAVKRLPLILCVPLLIGLWFVFQVLQPASQTLTHGFGAYYTASGLLRQGRISAEIYDPGYFRPLVEADSRQQVSDIYNANPPTTSLMFWSLSFLTIEQARIGWTVANAVMLWAGLTLLILTFADRPTPLIFTIVLSVGMLFQPVIANIRFGQAYLLVFLLMTIVVVAWWKHRDGIGGVALALAILLKTAGWLLIPWLIYRRRWRFLAWALGTAGIVLLITSGHFPVPMWQRYLELLQETVRSPVTCVTAYQTTRSMLCQLFVFDGVWNNQPLVHLPWLAAGLFAGLAVGTLVVILLLHNLSQILALMGVIVWGLLFAPLGEQFHHTIALIPVTWLLINWQSDIFDSRLGKICLVVALVAYLIPAQIGHDRFTNGAWVLLAYPRLYGLWFLFLAIASPLLRYHQPRFLHRRSFKAAH